MWGKFCYDLWLDVVFNNHNYYTLVSKSSQSAYMIWKSETTLVTSQVFNFPRNSGHKHCSSPGSELHKVFRDVGNRSASVTQPSACLLNKRDPYMQGQGDSLWDVRSFRWLMSRCELALGRECANGAAGFWRHSHPPIPPPTPPQDAIWSLKLKDTLHLWSNVEMVSSSSL
jgi:hypothetical protein